MCLRCQLECYFAGRHTQCSQLGSAFELIVAGSVLFL